MLSDALSVRDEWTLAPRGPMRPLDSVPNRPGMNVGPSNQIDGDAMTTPDPWSRPSITDLRAVLESIEQVDGTNLRHNERIELAVPAEVVTRRGNSVPAMTREISRLGIGLLHRGSISLGQVTVKMASESREYTYRVAIEWCAPCENGMFMSGGRFLSRPGASNNPDK